MSDPERDDLRVRAALGIAVMLAAALLLAWASYEKGYDNGFRLRGAIEERAPGLLACLKVEGVMYQGKCIGGKDGPK